MAFLHTSGGSEKKSVTQPRRALRGWLIGVSVFIVVVLVGLGGLLAYDVVYADRIYKGVAINGVDLAGMTRQQAYDTLQEIEQNLQASGIVFQHEQHSITLQPVIIPTDDPDLAKPILQYDWRRTLDLSQGYGRLSNPFANAVQKLRAASIGISLQPYVEIDETELLKILRERFNEFERPPVDAQLRIVNGQAEVQSEIDGFVFTYESALRQLRDQALEFHFSPISLSLEPRAAQIKKAETGPAVVGLDSVLGIPEIILTFQGRNWRISQATLHDWLAFQRTGEGDVVVGLKPQDLEEFLSLIAQDINVESQDAKFEITNNRVVEFQPSLEGREVDIEATIDLINGMILLGANVGDAPESAQTLELVVAVTPPKVAVGQLNELGIKEKLGEGRSNFAGSPANRRHNIAVGVASLNGILIAPDETFSQLSALGEIEASTGYLPELVIKGDRTIPEYGGGLCQISSTTFRAVLNAGLPITQRRNHSFQVRYYSPPGTDATIYDPAPDFQFVNDTGHYILFLARVQGDELVYEFWGTNDGREVILDPWPPDVYNIVSPGEPRYIETDELPPGETRKVESAVLGADAYFKYIIKYPDGEILEKEFFSHYIPWKETWFVGRNPSTVSTTTPDGTEVLGETSEDSFN